MKLKLLSFISAIIISLVIVNPPNTLADDNKSIKTECGGTKLICVVQSTTFSHNINKGGVCDKDKDDPQNDATAASGVRLSPEGGKPIPAVALPPAVRKGGAKWNSAVEVKVQNGNCLAFPYLDTGPAKVLVDEGKGIDLTGAADDLLNKKPTCGKVSEEESQTDGGFPEVQYYVDVNSKIPTGETKPCKHLNGVDPSAQAGNNQMAF